MGNIQAFYWNFDTNWNNLAKF